MNIWIKDNSLTSLQGVETSVSQIRVNQGVGVIDKKIIVLGFLKKYAGSSLYTNTVKFWPGFKSTCYKILLQ